MSDAPDPQQLAEEARALIARLAESGHPDSFGHLLTLQEHLALSLGTAARTLAEAQSWASVAGQAGTSRQAAWARWH